MAPPPPTADAPASPPVTPTWADLTAELDAWAAAGRTAHLWWRDDDAGAVTPQLEHLLTIAGRTAAPVALAVIPANTGPNLVRRLAAAPGAAVIQHGFAHIDHAPKGAGAWELGADRPLATVVDEVTKGRDVLRRLFPERFVPVMVPPWNRIDPTVTAALANLDFVALSQFGARPTPHAAPRLQLVNAHCDPIKWRGGARFTGTASALSDVIDHLRDRRSGAADPAEPTGLLTHHADMDGPAWAFVEDLLRAINDHPAAAWLTVAEVLA